ncbi:MAG TPA: hypothetical protein VN673_08400 [Clostridia bacterium]|nr:hypothetical protein [Clostridia bacterium]
MKTKQQFIRTRVISLFLLSVLSLLMDTGCGLLPRKETRAGMQFPVAHDQLPTKLPPITQRELQAEVMRFADRFLTVIDEATRDLGKAVEKPEARALAQRFKVDQMSSAITIAAGPNPTVNLVDMIVLLTLQRQLLEVYWVPTVYGEGARPLLDAYGRLEKEIWSMANDVLQPGQRQELQEIIHDWLVRNPDSHSTGYIPFHEFAREAGRYPPGQDVQPGSIFSLVFLDPLARLDPTQRSLEESKYLAERGMFYLQRMPKILQEQTQYTFLDLAQTREIQNAQAQAERFTRTTETFAQAAEQLPENFREERTAAVKQILDGLASERTNFFSQLLSQQQALHVSLRELREAFATGKDTAANVSAAANALSGFVDRIEQSRTSKRQPGSRPFDVREYGTAARDIGVGAEQLNSLLLSVEERSPQIDLVLSQARKQGEQWTDHIFWRGLLLSSLIIGQILLALLAYRYLVERFISKRHKT